jgi:hypothetical protein
MHPNLKSPSRLEGGARPVFFVALVFAVLLRILEITLYAISSRSSFIEFWTSHENQIFSMAGGCLWVAAGILVLALGELLMEPRNRSTWMTSIFSMILVIYAGINYHSTNLLLRECLASPPKLRFTDLDQEQVDRLRSEIPYSSMLIHQSKTSDPEGPPRFNVIVTLKPEQPKSAEAQREQEDDAQ